MVFRAISKFKRRSVVKAYNDSVQELCHFICNNCISSFAKFSTQTDPKLSQYTFQVNP